MQIAQACKAFGINAQQLKAALERHGVASGFGTTKTLKPAWLAALVAEFGPPDETHSEQVDAAFPALNAASLALDAALLALTQPKPTGAAAPAQPHSTDGSQAGISSPAVTTQPNDSAFEERKAPENSAAGSPSPLPKTGHSPEKKYAPKNGAATVTKPKDAEIYLGQVVEIVEEKRGFICEFGDATRLHFPGPAFNDKILPAKGEWVLFAARPLKNNPFRQEIYWVRPLGQDAALLQRLAKAADTATLEKLLQVGPEELKPQLAQALVGQLPPVSDIATWAAALRRLEYLTQWTPTALAESVNHVLLNAAPDYGWRLWLRFRPPLAASPAVADELMRLLENTPTVVTNWWPVAEQQGVPGLCLAYARQANQVGTALISLKAVLCPAQAPLYDTVLTHYLNATGPAPDAATFFVLRAAARSGYEAAAALEATVVAALSPVVALEVWLLDGKAVEFPRRAALDGFDALQEVEQARAVAEFTDEEFVTVLGSITQQSESAIRKRATALLNRLLPEALAAFGLDIESDGQAIHEIAWGSPGNWAEGRGTAGAAAALAALRERTASGPPYLAVGHNIRDFDAPVLARHGVALAPDSVWDTLLVEMALSPQWRVFALNTQHAAAADAARALVLFQSQVLRLLVLDAAAWELLGPLFSAVVRAQLHEWRAKRWGQWLTSEELQREAQQCLRPQPTASSQVQLVRQALADAPAQTQVVLAARALWEELAQTSGIRFVADAATEPDFCELHGPTLLGKLASQPVEAVLAARFFDHCQQAKLAPVPANMAPAVRVRLQQFVVLAECYAPAAPPEWQSAHCRCLSAGQLLTCHAQLRALPDVAVLVVAPDLITLANKRLLRDGLSAHDLLASEASRTEWVKFSGGQSFVGLALAQVQALGVAVPPGYHRFWLEKHRHGSYRVWGSFDWEPLLAPFAPEAVRYVGAAEADLQPRQLTCVAVNAQRLQQRLGVTPFNPESIYRARYWLLQAELLAGIGQRGAGAAPPVLLVQRPEELQKLAAYFRQLGYYVPEPEKEASLGRQLELLHESTNPRRLVIAPLARATALLQANYRGPLEVVVDSFNLLENYYLAHGSTLFERSQRAAAGRAEAPGEEDPEAEGAGEGNPASKTTQAPRREYLARDLHFLLELQRPVVQQLRALVVANDPQSRLWLLDPRLAEFSGLAADWQMQTRVVEDSWADTAVYEAAAQQADAVLGGARPARDFELNLEEAKSLLAGIFLRFREKGQWVQYDWKPEQVPYLDKILPAATDLLVSLPTGGGKSLLFQAPALYRSAYTNRLSIVVTPLKALMEDQVEALWKRGFYSSVEFLNQDKQDETQQIYRRLAGGELALLFITPERFRSRGFAKAFAQRLASDGGLEYAIYDEAHCISQWGHEFRPDYLHSAQVVEGHRQLCPHRFPVLLFSATVTEKIYEGFTQLFG